MTDSESQAVTTEIAALLKKPRKTRSDAGKKRASGTVKAATPGKKRAKKVAKQPSEGLRAKRIGAKDSKHDVSHYAKTTSATGAASLDCGDSVAKDLRGADLDAVYSKAAKILGEPIYALKAKYKHLNNGMIRMNLGNRMRAALDTGDEE